MSLAGIEKFRPGYVAPTPVKVQDQEVSRPLLNVNPPFVLLQIKNKIFNHDWIIAETLLASTNNNQLTLPLDQDGNTLLHLIVQNFKEERSLNRALDCVFQKCLKNGFSSKEKEDLLSNWPRNRFNQSPMNLLPPTKPLITNVKNEIEHLQQNLRHPLR